MLKFRFKKSLACTFFFRKDSRFWNSLPLEIKSSARYSVSMNRLNPHCPISKNSTHHVRNQPQLTSIRCMLRPRPQNITENNHRVCACGDIETELHLFFHCNVHCTAWTALYKNVHDILTKSGFAERFERLGHIDLLRLFLFCVPDASTSVSVSVLMLLTNSWNAIIDSSCTVYSSLHFLYACWSFLTLLYFWKLHVTRKIAPVRLAACSKIVVK